MSTIIGCIMVMVKEAVDIGDENSCYYNYNETTGKHVFDHQHPQPSSPLDFGKGLFDKIKGKKC